MNDSLFNDHPAPGDKPGKKQEINSYLKGRGAQINTPNRFEKDKRTKEDTEAIDEWEEPAIATQFLEVKAKTIVNKVESPDVGMLYSMNPYQGCEHGCIYCYARNTHEYWGYSAGVDFESRIMVKKNAPQLLRQFLQHPKWECAPISISGNTDCYQPAEKKFGLTRSLLQVCHEFNQPVGIITKNAAVLNDIDLLKQMAKKNLVSVWVSITTLNEDLRRVMEPRTTTAKQRLRVVRDLGLAGVPAGVLLAPMIPGLNEHEMGAIMKAAYEARARSAAYILVRLNGAVKLLFHDWLHKNFPDRADKVWHLIEESHSGKVNDSRFGVRMTGEGPIPEMIADQFQMYMKKYGLKPERTALDCSQFRRPGEQGRLF